jgi:hypothetical protein
VGQGFAFLGTLMGIFTIAIGVGPRSMPDLTYHVLILTALAWGFVATYRARPPIARMVQQELHGWWRCRFRPIAFVWGVTAGVTLVSESPGGASGWHRRDRKDRN